MLNAAAFYFDRHDPQVSVFKGVYFTTGNASRAPSFGGEWELAARPLGGLDVSLGVRFQVLRLT